jgi:hypothetical protein
LLRSVKAGLLGETGRQANSFALEFDDREVNPEQIVTAIYRALIRHDVE